MKLLIDQSISYKVAESLRSIFPGIQHVRDVSMENAYDQTLWAYAREHEFTIVTKDMEFSECAQKLGYPPRVIWIERGTCTTEDIERILREHIRVQFSSGKEE